MTGLNRIIGQIQFDAEACAVTAVTKAKIEAEAILRAAKAGNKAAVEAIDKQSDAAVADCLARAASAAALQKRRVILAAKQEIIRNIILKARQSLYALPNEEYFGIIVKMAVKFVLPQSGELMFSQKDLDRLPTNFEATLNEAVKAKGATLKILPESRRIDGGFVLVYGGVEENCSFEALFNAAHDGLQDKVHQLLFS